MLLDDHDRPLQRCSCRVADGARPSHPAMCVKSSEDIASVALRAVGRRSEDRYAPVCVCDDRGRLSGVVPIERLLESLARDVLE